MKKIRKIIINIFLITILIIGIGLIFIDPLQTFLIKRLGKNFEHHPPTPTIEENEISNDNFDFEEVQSLSLLDVLKAQANAKNLPVIGSIAIPTVDLQLPIIKGVANDALAVGAGTMKPNQKLGMGNYALAGHYFEGKDILFSPLYHVKKGDKVYLSDFDYVYEYEINDVQIIKATDVFYIDDIPSKTMLTLITCAEKGTKRLAVRGDYLNHYSFDNDPKQLQESF